MFYQVKILDAKGKVKKLISAKDLSKKYWKQFENNLTGQATSSLFKRKTRRGRRKKGSDPRAELPLEDYDNSDY